MADEKRHSRKLTFREIAEQHGHQTDPTDVKARSRNRRMLDNLYAAGLKLEEPNISDVARGSAIKATQDYLDRSGGKPVTPVDVQTTVVYQNVEQSLASLRETIAVAKARAAQSSPSRPAASERVQ